MTRSERKAPVVAVLNMKGGVGKTTIAAAVFRAIHKATKRRILLIDFDPQYSLTQLLLTAAKHDELVAEGRTLWHVLTPPGPTSIFHISDEDLTIPESVNSYVVTMGWVLDGKERVTIDLLPGNFQTAAINLVTESARLRVHASRFRALIQDARRDYDLVVLDCNPSSSFMTRTAVEVSTHLLVPVVPDRYSILGLDMIVDFIENLPTIASAPELSIIVNDLAMHRPQGGVLTELRSNSLYGPRTLVNTLPESRHLTARGNRVGFPSDGGGPYSGIVGGRLRQIANELAPKIGI